jgi:Ras-related protein Rab-6A
MGKLSKFKVVLVGDQNVGKTSIISRFIHDSFEFTSNVTQEDIQPTVGIDFVTKTMQVEG